MSFLRPVASTCPGARLAAGPRPPALQAPRVLEFDQVAAQADQLGDPLPTGEDLLVVEVDHADWAAALTGEHHAHELGAPM